MDRCRPAGADRRGLGSRRGTALRRGTPRWPAGEAGPGRRLVPLRGWAAALVAPALFPLRRRSGRLLPQAPAQRLLAPVPALLHLGAAGGPLSRPRLRASTRRIAR